VFRCVNLLAERRVHLPDRRQAVVLFAYKNCRSARKMSVEVDVAEFCRNLSTLSAVLEITLQRCVETGLCLCARVGRRGVQYAF
jgi:hypothetical protein